MANYTQLCLSQVRQLFGEFDLLVSDFIPLDGGNGNSSYIVKTDTATYVLTVCDDKTFEEVSITAQLLLLLETHHIPCTRLIKPLGRGLLTKFENKAVMLKGFIEGQVVAQPNEKQLLQLGQQAAKLNQVPAPEYLPNDHPYGRLHFVKIMGLGIDNKYEVWLANEIEHLARSINDQLPKGLIHGDLFYDNFLFEGNQFQAFIDFEEACHYYLVFELGMAIVGACVNKQMDVDLIKVRALVEGYQQIRPLAQIEKNSLQLFVRYAATATSYWRFNKYNIEMPSRELANHHWQMAQLSQAVGAIAPTQFFDAVFG